jgi:hypothetical protein
MRRCTFCTRTFSAVMDLTDRACACGECLMKAVIAPMPIEGSNGWTIRLEGDTLIAASADVPAQRGSWVSGHRTRIPVSVAERLRDLTLGKDIDVEKAVADLDELLERMTVDGRVD